LVRVLLAAMTAYYNEVDRYCCDWLSNLMDAGHITPGKIDDRSIVDVSPDDVRGFERVHWFAGIAGWDHALNLAGWPDTRPVWTGSCPCQPFSAAGKGGGGADERHLWPHWFRLIRECKPRIVFGENVEAAIGWGWLDAVLGDLEAEGYATGAAVLGAHSVGAPHRRDRLWFVANRVVAAGELADAADGRREPLARQRRVPSAQAGNEPVPELGIDGNAGLLADPLHAGRPERRPGAGDGQAAGSGGAGPWHDLVWLPCTDGRARPVIADIFPLVDGSAFRLGAGGPLEGKSRVGMLRAAGNCIVPQAAAEFIGAYMGM